MYVTYKADNYPCCINIDEVSECPRCHKSIKPIVLYSHFHQTTWLKVLDVHMECPACNNTFFASYSLSLSSDGVLFSTHHYVAPQLPPYIDWGEIIEEISPDFVEIYLQAASAETFNLSQIAGVGYRKALEFLIKDYLISQTFDQTKINTIKNKFLGKCIKDDIDNPQLKAVASRAAWLGNDQTHYEQRFSDRDITDLKQMIRLTVHWISLIKETEEAQNIKPRQ